MLFAVTAVDKTGTTLLSDTDAVLKFVQPVVEFVTNTV